MTDPDLNPLIQEQLELERQRQANLRLGRLQAAGMIAAAILFLLYRILHTPSAWLFPDGWWRW